MRRGSIHRGGVGSTGFILRRIERFAVSVRGRIYLPLETAYMHRVYRNKTSRYRFPTFAMCADYAIYEKGITRSCHEPSITTKDGAGTFGAL